MKKAYDPPLLPLHTSREVRQRKRNGFPSTPTLASVRLHRNEHGFVCRLTQILPGQQERLIRRGPGWTLAVRRAHPSSGTTWISSSIFQLNISLACVFRRLSAYGAKDKHFEEKQMSKIKGHFPWHFTSTGNTSTSPLFLPMVWRAQMPVRQNTTSINFSARQGWDGEVGSSTYNPFIE